MFTEMSMNCSFGELQLLVNLHGFLDGLDNGVCLRNKNFESVEFLFDWSFG